MIRILFICHGNICRSPLAEFVMKQMVRDRGIESDFLIASAATSTEELGNDIYPPMQEAMRRHGIEFEHRGARQVKRGELEDWDLLICMDRRNLKNLERMYKNQVKGRVSLLLSYAGRDDEVEDPWYSRDFEQAYEDVVEGCEGLLSCLGY